MSLTFEVFITVLVWFFGYITGYLVPRPKPTEWAVFDETYGYVTKHDDAVTSYSENATEAFVFRDRDLAEWVALRQGCRVIDKQEVA